jgi:rod shape-determining protein MreB and related proteins
MRLRPGIAIDLGTVNTLISVNGRGLVVEEPSAVAIDKANGTVAAVGDPAEALAGKEPVDVEVVYPLRDGVIADIDACAAMLAAFLQRARVRRGLGVLRPYALVCVPSGATWVERQSIPAAVAARKPRCIVALVDEAVAAAAGAGVDMSNGEGAFIVDIGGGTTEVAVVAGGRAVRAQSLRLGGNAMDEAIINAARSELGLILGTHAARRLKRTLGLTGGSAGFAETVGVDLGRRTPRTDHVSGQLVAQALEPLVSLIVRAVEEMLFDIPPNLAEDVLRGKIRLAGGGALLAGLADRIEETTGIPAVVVDDPLRCVVRGAAGILEHGGGIVASATPT